MGEPTPRTKGVACIKPEYILSRAHHVEEEDDDAAERATNPATSRIEKEEEEERHTEVNGEEQDSKRVRLNGGARKQAKREAEWEKKKARGQNKGRKFAGIRDQVSLCHATAQGRECNRAGCTHSHSIKDYLLIKERDIAFPKPPRHSQHGGLKELSIEEQEEYLDQLYLTSPPFVKFESRESREDTDVESKIYFETSCPVLASQVASSSSKEKAFCNAGWSCRFLGGHICKVGNVQREDGLAWQLSWNEETDAVEEQKDKEDFNGHKNAPDELNYPAPGVMKSLRSRKYPLYLTKAALKHLEKERQHDIVTQGHNAQATGRGPIYLDQEEAKSGQMNGSKNVVDLEDLDALMNEGVQGRLEDAQHAMTLQDKAKLKPSEKRRLNWFHDELYLAPLTTTGNLPFRKLCCTLGNDISCGEMGLAECFLQGQKNEWSLVRRWKGERCFGTQLCGNKPEQLIPAAEMLAREFPNSLDFIDVNCGCPIDMVYNKGAGSALLDHPSKLGKIIRGMSAVSGDIPITIKLRTGTSNTSTSTLKFFPRIKPDWNTAAVTLHGRSRQQRYKSLADWDYIRQCTTSLRESIRVNNEERPDEEWVHPIPIYGNGDVYSWQDYQHNKEMTGVDGQMLARGALIKPWLFTEIKEKRDWDISSRERLDLIRQLTSYGLTHWGSDTMGVNTTRRFVCESLSFTHRYVPIGILQHLPAKLNERPPPYQGRNELETLLASGNAKDWVKITEMFLGKAPEEFQFIPKHKSSSYDDDGAENQG